MPTKRTPRYGLGDLEEDKWPVSVFVLVIWPVSVILGCAAAMPCDLTVFALERGYLTASAVLSTGTG
jgi:hypothetical protein